MATGNGGFMRLASVVGSVWSKLGSLAPFDQLINPLNRNIGLRHKIAQRSIIALLLPLSFLFFEYVQSRVIYRQIFVGMKRLSNISLVAKYLLHLLLTL